MTGTETWGLAVFILLVFLILYLSFVKPFLQGMREGDREIESDRYRIPERCPMCGEKTLMTHELRCAQCGEYLGPPDFSRHESSSLKSRR